LGNIGHRQTVWDFGANDGRYSRLAVQYGAHVVAFDADPIAVERNFNVISRSHESMLPLIFDITTPSPGIGFSNRERITIEGRQKPDVIMMLAVIHHMAISNNLPFEMIALWLAERCKYLIIEFVPKDDLQVQILLRSRTDIFSWYNQENFESVFFEHFGLVKKQFIEDSKRTIYLLKSKKIF
jgi:hypothetical protein